MFRFIKFTSVILAILVSFIGILNSIPKTINETVPYLISLIPSNSQRNIIQNNGIILSISGSDIEFSQCLSIEGIIIGRDYEIKQTSPVLRLIVPKIKKSELISALDTCSTRLAQH